MTTCALKHALVTGASTGIGRAVALRLARRGVHVFATVRKSADGERLEQASERRLTSVLMDVTDAAQIEQARAALYEHVGERGLDALVNNAGVGLAWPLELVPLDRFRSQMDINVHGQLAVTQAFLGLIRRARGRVIMIGSVGDRITLPFIGPLAVAKHALLALTEALRRELAPWGIRVILIEPASIRTDAIDKFERDTREAIDEFGPEGSVLYADAFRSMTARFTAREQHGSDPEVVAAAVVSAVEASRPKARYLVGRDAQLLAFAAKLPSAMLDSLIRRVFALPGPGADLVRG